MNGRDTEALAVRVRTATQQVVEDFFAERNAVAIASRKEVRKARKKGIRKEDDTWTEAYDVRVRHYGSSNGRNAEITLIGSKRSYYIEQEYDPYSYLPKAQRAKPKWRIRIDNEGEGSGFESSTDNFEAAVQNSIVALLGHGYYHLDD